MKGRDGYLPGPARGARVEQDGDKWTLVLTRRLRHPPPLVWEALTDPAHLSQWAPFDADRHLGSIGPMTLSTVGAQNPQVSVSHVTQAVAPTLLEYGWGENHLRWTLEPDGEGTRLTLWHNIDRRFIAWGAAGWHICLDVLDRLGTPEAIGRVVGPDAMKFDWQRLSTEYAAQFGVENPSWSNTIPRN